MTLIEHAPARDEVLDFANDSIRLLQASGLEPKYILAGPAAYEALRAAMADRFRREAGFFETYQYIPIVVDPAREDTVCLLPSPRACAEGARIHRTDPA